MSVHSGMINAVLRAKMGAVLSLLNNRYKPNINALNDVVRNINMLHLNVKTLGYELARQLSAALPVQQGLTPRHVGLSCKASIQADLESDWVAQWCAALQIPVMFHRKVWELAYVLQAIYENGHIREGARGLGFGCGVEPLPSLLASRGVSITMTDLEPVQAAESGWIETHQHMSDRDGAFRSELVDRATFDEKVRLRYVDMNAIPADLTDFDFCWSICALEHLGTIEKGLAFVENSLATLKPGGLSVHTTEYNINPDGPTVDDQGTVLYQKHHVEALATRLRAKGHFVAPFDFALGDKPLDRFIDVPPFHPDLGIEMQQFLGNPLHLKVAVDGFACTCFGLLIRKVA
ncbi:SAM-dependent methyltransferase [Sphingomonas morindae]|uniref:Methyltransferase domain-containing protein n=1 Tax=Sphingomonas morindae TaxID=1541170 RepID=A0ABY4X664_9SPHN|nr:methyltransferase domain-containing protein [Sphingomonas morindae]USI72379.1 methyltransferase domain-containing protein [Sphingomonas morindae]